MKSPHGIDLMNFENKNVSTKKKSLNKFGIS
jgi:hypothetical protein